MDIFIIKKHAVTDPTHYSYLHCHCHCCHYVADNAWLRSASEEYSQLKEKMFKLIFTNFLNTEFSRRIIYMDFDVEMLENMMKKGKNHIFC